VSVAAEELNGRKLLTNSVVKSVVKTAVALGKTVRKRFYHPAKPPGQKSRNLP
jgi:hypothetical protein